MSPRAAARAPSPRPLHPRPYYDTGGVGYVRCKGGGGCVEQWGPLRSPLDTLLLGRDSELPSFLQREKRYNRVEDEMRTKMRLKDYTKGY